MSSRRDSKMIQSSPHNEQIKPWNSLRVQRMSTLYRKPMVYSSIFSLSNCNVSQHRTINQNKVNEKKSAKPSTAPDGKGYRNINISKELSKLNNITKQEIITGDFEENVQSIHCYANFRTSVQQKKQLLFLKPQMKITSRYHRNLKNKMNTNEGLEKLKTEIYKNIQLSQRENDLQVINAQKSIKKKGMVYSQKNSFIQYMTEFEGQSINTSIDNYSQIGPKSARCSRKRNKSITVLREKLKNNLKSSKYIQKIGQMKIHSGLPITIIN